MIAFWKVVRKPNLDTVTWSFIIILKVVICRNFNLIEGWVKNCDFFVVVNWHLDCTFKKGVLNSKYSIGGREMHKQTQDSLDCWTLECPWAVCSALSCLYCTLVRRTLLWSFAGDSITNSNQSSYQEEITNLAEWCTENSLKLSVSKTKEPIKLVIKTAQKIIGTSTTRAKVCSLSSCLAKDTDLY